MKTDLSTYDNDWFDPGAGWIKRALWFITNLLFFKSGWAYPSSLKRLFLRLYGATIGKGVVIKPSVNIKYAWNLEVGSYSWIGEKVWIDNLVKVTIGNNACLSQGSMLLCGNHDYRKTGFDLIVKEIALEDGVWIGARALLGPGSVARSHAVLSAGSVATGELVAEKVYRGNPAQIVHDRF